MMNSGGGHSGSSQDFDLNLAPIIDCFTVLITFLLISASFLSIGILDAGISAPGAQTESEPQGASVDLTLKITADRGYRIKIEGTQPGSGRESEESIKSAKPLDLAALAQKL
ncbi:MAG: biopolymer transporter ExbD, partial [Bdellovibrionota bacterium]